MDLILLSLERDKAFPTWCPSDMRMSEIAVFFNLSVLKNPPESPLKDVNSWALPLYSLILWA